MKKNYLNSLLGVILALSSIFLSCEKEEESFRENLGIGAENSIVEIAQSSEDLSILVEAILKADENENTDLVGLLSGEGPFTVFAPTNDAFVSFLEDIEGYSSLEDFDTQEEKSLLAKILAYHVAQGIITSSEITDGEILTTLQSEELRFIKSQTIRIADKTNQSALVVKPDVNASNGIIHLVNKVLLPQEAIDAFFPRPNLVEIVIETEKLSLLEQAVIKTDLLETLQSEGPFTVFAPEDEAFAQLLMALGDEFNSLDDFDTEEEIQLLRQIVLYHVIPGQTIPSTELQEGSVSSALTGNTLEIISKESAFVIGDATDIPANILEVNFFASNGVAHIIDKVLLPQIALEFLSKMQLENIVEIATSTNDLSLLVDALVQANAGLVEALQTDGPFTVFAPTNHAFVQLLEALGDDYNSLSDFDTQEEKDLLVAILTYHVVQGSAVFSSDISEGQQVSTLNGDFITFSLDNGVFLNDKSNLPARVITPDIEASNGVVHLIDKVLLPQIAIDFINELQLKNIVEIAIESDDLSLLVDALVQANAGLVEALQTDGPFTVFAPTNHAFVQLLEALGDDYHSLSDFDTQEEKDLLVAILTYHVVQGSAVFSSELTDGQEILTLQGEKIVAFTTHEVRIQDKSDIQANVIQADIEASNGVIHVIDKVLLPQVAIDFIKEMQIMNIVELAVATDNLSILVEALGQSNADLVGALQGSGPFTVFAPNNHAFENLFNALGNEYHSIADFDTFEEKQLLTTILTYHVISGAALLSSDLSDGLQFTTLQGEKIVVFTSHEVRVQDKTNVQANVITADIVASNGVIHIIDKVLIPQAAIDALAGH